MKPTKEAEAIFYETVNDRAPELIPFIPVYHGRRTLPSSEDDIRSADDFVSVFSYFIVLNCQHCLLL